MLKGFRLIDAEFGVKKFNINLIGVVYNMENKVYYGEYSLDYWIRLILSKNIILPEYQRNFSWTDEKRKKLILSLQNKEFIPPVIIGSFSKDEENKNLLIDGQQRLTSILLTFLGYFPDRETYKKDIRTKKYIDENDDRIDEMDVSTDVINWSFNDLLKDDTLTIQELKKILEKDKYFKPLKTEEMIDESFLKNTFLGFSYLVPDKKGSQQKYYSSVFRNINRQGMSLTGQESREALYYLDERWTDFFKPKFIDLLPDVSTIDFIRYASILSQYKKENSAQNLCSGYGGRKEKIEEYYEDYIKFVIDDKDGETDTLFDPCPLKTSQGKINLERFENMENIINSTSLKEKKFESIIDCDMYYFGLIYSVVFENKNIDLDRWDILSGNIDNQISLYKAPFINDLNESTYEISEKKDVNYHQKNPAALKYLRERVENSISIYKEFEQ